jgi:hypothetical protein
MRRFVLWRTEDPNGTSGTGAVVEGIEFSDGRVALRWMTARRSTCTYDSMDDVEAIHGHEGLTTVQWVP